MIRILINGICGQMGRAISEAAANQSGLYSVVAGVDRAPADSSPVPVYASCDDVEEPFDVLVDFSVPAALPDTLRLAQKHRVPIIVGTTGLTERHLRLLEGAAKQVPVFQTGNMSLGVNLQMELIRHAKATLGSGFDVEIIERHHRRKVDAPSGTALMLARCIQAESTGESELVFGRHETNKRRADGEIGLHSVRGGTIVGEHEVLFLGRDEVVEINHRAYSKQVFAVGALRAASFLLGKQNGLYNMQDIVNESNVASHVSAIEGQAILHISGLPADGKLVRRILARIAEQGVFVDMISMALPGGTDASLGFTVPQKQLGEAVNTLIPLRAEYGFELFAEGDVTKLVIEGPGMARRSGVAADLLGILEDADIRIRLITTSETKIELCVSAAQAARAAAEIQQQFLKQY